MGALLAILACLFLALFVLVKLSEKYAKPMDAEQQQSFSKIIVVLVGVMLVAGLVNFLMEG